MPLRLLWTEQSTVEGNYGDGGAGAELNPLAIHAALMFTLVGSCISMISVWLHWKNYRKPVSCSVSPNSLSQFAEPTTASHSDSVDVSWKGPRRNEAKIVPSFLVKP